MDAASIRAAAHRDRVAAAKARYDAEARAAALQYGTATFPIRNYEELKDARDSMMTLHPAGTVQRVHIIRDHLNDRGGKPETPC
jgi:hypothetical protein